MLYYYGVEKQCQKRRIHFSGAEFLYESTFVFSKSKFILSYYMKEIKVRE